MNKIREEEDNNNRKEQEKKYFERKRCTRESNIENFNQRIRQFAYDINQINNKINEYFHNPRKDSSILPLINSKVQKSPLTKSKASLLRKSILKKNINEAAKLLEKPPSKPKKLEKSRYASLHLKEKESTMKTMLYRNELYNYVSNLNKKTHFKSVQNPSLERHFSELNSNEAVERQRTELSEFLDFYKLSKSVQFNRNKLIRSENRRNLNVSKTYLNPNIEPEEICEDEKLMKIRSLARVDDIIVNPLQTDTQEDDPNEKNSEKQGGSFKQIIQKKSEKMKIRII